MVLNDIWFGKLNNFCSRLIEEDVDFFSFVEITYLIILFEIVLYTPLYRPITESRVEWFECD